MEDKQIVCTRKKKNIVYILAKILLTTIFSATIFLDSILVFVQDLRASVNEIYFGEINLKNIIIFLVTWIITFFILTIIEYTVTKVEKEIYKNGEKGKRKRVFFIIFGILILMWLPYILTYFPGGIFSDTLASIRQCMHLQPYDNANPLAYTLILKIFLKIGDIFNSAQIGINSFAIFQIIVMAAILSYFVYWLYKKNFSNLVLVLITLFLGMFKLIPMYALSIWKDTPFSLALFVYIIVIAQIVCDNGKKLKEWKNIVLYVVLLFALSFLRNNGFYIVTATTVLLLIVYRKNEILKFAISSIVALVVIFVIKGPIFSALGLNGTPGSWNAIMVDQIFYVTVTDGNITEEQLEFIDTMCDVSTLKEVYSPLLLDATTVNPAFNNEFIKSHSSEVRQLWIELFLQNPSSYVKSYLLKTLGFWNVNRAFNDAYISNFMWPGTEEVINVQQTDYIEKWTGQSIVGKIQIARIYSSAIFLSIMLISMIFTIRKRKFKNLLIYLPALFAWGTIMLATPIAFSLRYVYILVLMLPFNFVIPFLSIEGKNVLKKENEIGEENENTTNNTSL